jgi:hypothetical protein
MIFCDSGANIFCKTKEFRSALNHPHIKNGNSSYKMQHIMLGTLIIMACGNNVLETK